MERLPLFFDIRDRAVLLVGDGPAADAKRRLIEGAGGRIVADAGAARLAFVALEGAAADAEAARLKAAGLLVNVVDRPELCDFLVPAIVDRSPVIVAIGTNGASATLAKVLRERLEALLPATLGALARAIAARRPEVAARVAGPDRRGFWDRLLAAGGPLDPFGGGAFGGEADADAAIDAALAGRGTAGARLDVVPVTSDDPDDLTLRQLRLLSQADTIFHTAAVSAAILDRARRDADRILCTAAPPAPAGRSIYLCRADATSVRPPRAAAQARNSASSSGQAIE